MTYDNENRIELISLNEFTQVDENDIELGDEDERPFPDSDEAIRALQDDVEVMEVLIEKQRKEIEQLRAELKTALAERDEARRGHDYWRSDLASR